MGRTITTPRKRSFIRARFDANEIKGELQELWQGISGDEILIKRKPSPVKHKPPTGAIHNQYAKKKKLK